MEYMQFDLITYSIESSMPNLHLTKKKCTLCEEKCEKCEIMKVYIKLTLSYSFQNSFSTFFFPCTNLHNKFFHL